MPGNPYEAAGRAVKLLREDLAGISTKVSEIRDEVMTISQRVSEIKKQLTEIEGRLPVRTK